MRKFWEWFYKDEPSIDFCGLCNAPLGVNPGEILYDALDEDGTPQRHKMKVCASCGDTLDQMAQLDEQ